MPKKNAPPLEDKLAKPQRGRPVKWDKKAIEEEMSALRQWARFPQSIVLRKFVALRGYSWSTLHDIIDNYPEFKECWEWARMEVGSRREELALHGELDSGLVGKTLSQYDPEHFAVIKELKNTEQARPQTFNIHVRGAESKTLTVNSEG